MVTIQSLGIDKLPIENQLQLVQAIWENIAGNHAMSTITIAQRKELQRRIAEDDASPDDHVSWEQVKANTRKRIQE